MSKNLNSYVRRLKRLNSNFSFYFNGETLYTNAKNNELVLPSSKISIKNRYIHYNESSIIGRVVYEYENTSLLEAESKKHSTLIYKCKSLLNRTVSNIIYLLDRFVERKRNIDTSELAEYCNEEVLKSMALDEKVEMVSTNEESKEDLNKKLNDAMEEAGLIDSKEETEKLSLDDKLKNAMENAGLVDESPVTERPSIDEALDEAISKSEVKKLILQ